MRDTAQVGSMTDVTARACRRRAGGTQDVVGCLVLAVLVGTWPSGVPAQPLVPLSDEFQVNTYTTGYQFLPSVALDGAGKFLVAWAADEVIRGQRYDGMGLPQAPEFVVATDVFGLPTVAANAAGDAVVVWSGPPDPLGGIVGRRYDASGVPQDGEFQISTYTTGYKGPAKVAMDGTGRFVVVWSSAADQDGSGLGIFARRFDGNGTSLGGEFQVNTYTTGTQADPSIAVDGAGNFVVVWIGGGGQDGDGAGVLARRFDADGLPQGGEFQVNTYTTGSQLVTFGGQAVAADGAGRFVVVWWSDYDIFGRRYAGDGAPLGGEFQVNTYTTGTQRYPVVASSPAGDFVVAWSSYADGDQSGVVARRYDGAGVPQGDEFQVNTYTTGAQGYPPSAIATDAAGNFIVTWSSDGSTGTDTSFRSVQARRFAPGRPVLGRKMLVRNPTGSEDDRTVIALAKEAATDVGATVLGNPTLTGATLRIRASGGTPSDQVYALDAAGWSTLGSVGYRYAGPTGGDGDPVRKVLVKRTPGGTALVKAILKGHVGSQSLDVVPPNLGGDGGFILAIPAGGTYCATFGGAAGGTEVKDTAQLWKVTNATAQGCPTP